ncbi:MAG TPA: hypothetical protein VFC03_21015, partial [Acidimicrobiales bacterium]|nr:hypothetical protein [Acidimicrobiales bacterium]
RHRPGDFSGGYLSEGWGLLVAKSGDFRGHQRGPQLAITGYFLVATDNWPDRFKWFRNGPLDHARKVFVISPWWPRLHTLAFAKEVQERRDEKRSTFLNAFSDVMAEEAKTYGPPLERHQLPWPRGVPPESLSILKPYMPLFSEYRKQKIATDGGRQNDSPSDTDSNRGEN